MSAVMRASNRIPEGGSNPTPAVGLTTHLQMISEARRDDCIHGIINISLVSTRMCALVKKRSVAHSPHNPGKARMQKIRRIYSINDADIFEDNWDLFP